MFTALADEKELFSFKYRVVAAFSAYSNAASSSNVSFGVGRRFRLEMKRTFFSETRAGGRLGDILFSFGFY
jgi:hypothetical protein